MVFRALIICLLAASCAQQAANVSPELKQAGEFQNEALKAYWKVSQDYRKDVCLDSKTVLDKLRNKMIDIPGVPHDHKYCNGKHRSSDIELTDQEMLAVQKEWHDSIFAKIKIYQDCIAGL